jgi:hypothetical protein
MFKFNGFTISILANKVIASNQGVSFEFKTVEDAISTLSKL